MSTLKVKLTDTLRSYLEKQATKKGFQSPDEYVQSLLTDMQHRDESRRDLEDKLREGMCSPLIEADDAFWRDLREEFLADYPELKSCEK